MQYDKYESKIQKIADFIKLLFKHKIKVLIALAAVMAMLCTFLATRGIILSTGVCPTEITYGETLKYSGDALMSKTGLEYRKVGEKKWTSSAPKDPGAYEVRVVADATFGKRHGEIKTFTLLPKPVSLSIQENQISYGNTPTVLADLNFKDKIAHAEFVYNEETGQMEIDAKSVLVQDEKGKDVTNRYAFTVQPKTLQIVPRPITVSVSGATKVYDAQPLTCEDYAITEGSLADGDQMIVSFLASLTDAGSLANAVKITVFNQRGADVTDFYQITKEEGVLTVEKRPVTVQTEGGGFVYNGKDHTFEKLTEIPTEYGLISGHTFGNVHGTVFNDVVRKEGVVISKQNTVSFSIIGGGRDVTDNYEITYEYGEVTVSPSPIVVKTTGFTREYDGKNYSNDVLKPQNTAQLYVGHVLKASAIPEFCDVVSNVENKVVCKIVKSATNKDVTGNYEITYEYGKVTITPRAVTFASASAEKKAYDGEPLEAKEWEVVGSKDLVKDHALVGVTITGIQTDAGSSKNTYTGTPRIEDGEGKDQSKNYAITLTEGTLTVGKRPVVIATESAEKKYDGTPLTAPTWTVDKTSPYQLVGKDKIVGATITGTRTDVGTSANSYTGTVSFENGEGVSVNHNYHILNVLTGKLQITPRQIHVVTGSLNEMYSGKPRSNPTWELTKTSPDGLAPNQTFAEIKGATTITDVGSVSNGFGLGELTVLDAQGNPVKEGNYQILSKEKGTLTITVRPVAFYTDGVEKVYDGNPWQSDEVHQEVNEAEGKYSLCEGHKVAVDKTSATAFTNVTTRAGIYPDNEVDFIIVDEKGVAVKEGNYQVSTTYGEVVIRPYAVKVQTPSVNQPYDGNTYTFTDIEILPELLKGGLWEHKYQIDFATEFYAPIENEPNVVEISIWESRLGTDAVVDVTNNYDIDYESLRGKVTITPVAIRVTTGSDAWTYDGKFHMVDAGFNIEGLPVGYTCSVKFKTFKDVVSNALNEVVVVIYNSATQTPENDVTENFEFDNNFGTVSVYVRPITVKTYEITVEEYDGKFYSDGRVEIARVEEPLAFDLCDGHYFDVTYIPEFRNVTAPNTLNDVQFEIKDETNEPVPSGNYEITYDFGEVVISPRFVTVKTPDGAWLYDGNAHSNSVWEIVAGSFVDGDFLSAPRITGEITEVQRDENDNVIGLPNEYAREPYQVMGSWDETQNYVITISETLGTLTLTPIEVTVTTASKEVTYSGKVVTAKNWEILSGAFILDHTMVSPAIITEVYGIAEEGVVNRYDTTQPIVVANGAGVHKTHNYNVTIDDGNLGKIIVNRITLNVQTASATKIYDGAPLTAKEWIVTKGNLLEGHYVDVENITGSCTNVKDSAENTYVGEVIIRDAEGSDGTMYYDVSASYGTLTVNPRKVILTTPEKDWVYDGSSFKDGTITITQDLSQEAAPEGSPCYNDVFTATESSIKTFRNVWESGENAVEYTITNAGNPVDEENYIIIENFGWVNIAQRRATLSSISIEKEYDGIPVSNGELIVTFDPMQALAPDAPCHNYVFKVTNPRTYCDVIETVNELEFEIWFGEEQISKENYDFGQPSWGTVRITPRYIVLYTYGGSFTYDGKEHVFDNGCSWDGDFAYGQEYELVFPTFKNVSDSGYNIPKIQVRDKATQDVVFDTETAFGPQNYVVNYENCGWIQVNRRYVVVESASEDKVYDGIPVTDVSADNLCQDDYGTPLHTLSLDLEKAQKDVTYGALGNAERIENPLIESEEEVVILDENGKVVTENYEVDLWRGQVKISPREIYVYTNSYFFVYDGKDHVFDDWDYIGSLAPDQTWQVDFPVFNAVASSGKNKPEILVKDQSGGGVTYNYAIYYDGCGSVTVSPREISVETATEQKFYDGQGITGVFVDNLCVDDILGNPIHYVFVDYTKAQVNVTKNAIGEVVEIDNPIIESKEEVVIYDAFGLDVTENYVIASFVRGRVQILPRPIAVQTESVEKEYDAISVSGVFADDLCEWHSISLAENNGQVNVTRNAFGEVASIPNPIQENDVVIYNDLGEEVTENYTVISFTPGLVLIRPRAVTVQTGSAEKPFDGIPLTAGWEILEGSFIPGHTLTKPTLTGEQTEQGWSYNTYRMEEEPRVMSGGEDVSANYAVTISSELGVLTISTKSVIISTGSQTWEYDGQPHSLTDYSMAVGLISGHYIELKEGEPVASITVPGNVANELVYIIKDSEGNDVSQFYTISYNPGTLTVENRLIYLETGSADKDYDGSWLTCEEWSYYSNDWPQNWQFEVEIEFTERIMLPGEVENAIILRNWWVYEYNEYGGFVQDHTQYCEIADIYLGYLVVYEPLNEEITYAVVNANVDTTLYLKMESFGDYTGKGFATAPRYTEKIEDYYVASYLTTLALGNGGGSPHSVTVKTSIPMLPYYSSLITADWQTDDATVKSPDIYTTDFYLWGNTGITGYSAFEENYRGFVYANYGYETVDAETLAYMESLIATHGFDANDPKIVEKVAEFIKRSAVYNLNYNAALDREENVILSFMQTYKEGVCRHYAAAATMLFRALGIPARYSTGFAVQTISGMDVDVTSKDAHAWVEIYVDGVGWRYVEVTGSPLDPDKDTILVKPQKQSSKYVAGEPFVINQTIERAGSFIGLEEDVTLSYLLRQGYTYSVKLNGRQQEVGTGVITATEFVLYDPFGLPVTQEYNVIFEVGELQVYGDIIAIYFSPSRNNIYSGAWFGVSTFYYVHRPEGVTLNIINNNISLRDVGALKASQVNENLGEFLEYTITRDVDGVDVTENYILRICAYGATEQDGEGYEKDYDIITVNKHKLVISTKSGMWNFDGKEHSASGVDYLKNTSLPTAVQHTLTLETTTVIQFPGSLLNTYTEGSLRIMRREEDGFYVDVTDNFDVEISLGTLTVIG